MWLKNDLNLAQMIFPFPLGVVVALQMICAWLYPILKLFIVFLFCKFWNKFLDLCLKIHKTQKLLIY